MKSFIALLALLALFTLISAAQAEVPPPIRTISGNVVVSPRDPAAHIEVPAAAKYVGAVRFALFGAADCEIHLFVEGDPSKRVQRVYWLQFEAYLPEQPDLRYALSPAYSPLEMSGLPFYQRARFGLSSEVPRVGSDTQRAYSLLAENGYTLPPETTSVTYKHFFADMRKELLLIVIEDMSLSGITFTQLVQNGKVQATWPPIAEQIMARASTAFSVRLTSQSKK